MADASNDGTSSGSGSSGVLGGLGKFHIWMEIIFGPIVLLLFIGVLIFLWRYQRGWTWTHGIVQNTPKCALCDGNNCQAGQGYSCAETGVLVNVKGKDEQWQFDTINASALRKGDKITVCYNPGKPSQHDSTQGCMSPHARDIICAFILVLLVLAAGWWFVNLHYRKNATFQKISGVMEGADIAQDIFGRR